MGAGYMSTVLGFAKLAAVDTDAVDARKTMA